MPLSALQFRPRAASRQPPAATVAPQASGTTAAINKFCVDNKLLMVDNPCISPDFCLNWPAMRAKMKTDGMPGIEVYEKSGFATAAGNWKLARDDETGDFAWILSANVPGAGAAAPFDATKKLITAPGVQIFPATWQNLLIMKNLVLEHDAANTMFPTATGTLEKKSLGIGARFTTMHYPATEWAMWALDLSLTGNQNSIPRELVYDVDEMLEGRLGKIPFVFIGADVPEGHCGQSVEGMSHASVISKLQTGFHLRRIPWGFNADHQPVGGKWDVREDALVKGSILSSYITYDVSHQLLVETEKETPDAARAYLASCVPTGMYAAIEERVKTSLGGFDDDDAFVMELAFVWPALCKMKLRDEKYRMAREAAYTTEAARKYYRELSVDEMPGLTQPLRIATCLALCEQLGMAVEYIAPAFGFQKNFPFPDNTLLEARIGEAYAVCKTFGVSMGFHSGSGKSAENYGICGRVCEGNLEVKTSGRYTYELGKALCASPEKSDNDLWIEWYNWSLKLAVQSSFTDDETEKNMARSFITETFNKDEAFGSVPDGTWDSPEKCLETLQKLAPSPNHMVWFEYNFLFILASNGSHEKSGLGDHSPVGYAQRARFYGGLTDAGRLLFAKGIASYIIFLADTTGQCSKDRCRGAYSLLDSYKTYGELMADIGPAPPASM